MEDRNQMVLAVPAKRTDRGLKVDLGRHPGGDRACRPVDLCHVRHDSMMVRAWLAARAIRMYWSMPIASPRRAGSTPASRSTRSAACAEPAQEARADLSVLRRCANAASITANTAVRLTLCWPRPGWAATLSAGVPASGQRVNATSAESTFGAGQNTLLDTVPARREVPYQASLTDGTP